MVCSNDRPGAPGTSHAVSVHKRPGTRNRSTALGTIQNNGNPRVQQAAQYLNYIGIRRDVPMSCPDKLEMRTLRPREATGLHTDLRTPTQIDHVFSRGVDVEALRTGKVRPGPWTSQRSPEWHGADALAARRFSSVAAGPPLPSRCVSQIARQASYLPSVRPSSCAGPVPLRGENPRVRRHPSHRMRTASATHG